jgi:HD-GYP domain-containing protein (c-di-GMP phosphodiesterase class II)
MALFNGLLAEDAPWLPQNRSAICPGCAVTQLYRERSYRLEDTDLSHLREKGIDHLYIRLNDADAYRGYLCEHVLHQVSIPLPVRMKALREITRVTFEDALVANGCDKLVNVAEGFGHELAAMIFDSTPVMSEVFKTLEHDYYTFTHVCNVSLYCALLGRGLGLDDQAEIAELAAAGLLHDIGKRYVPQHILNKTEKLTDAEWELIVEHPTTGFRELVHRGELSWPQLMVVYQHHERLDGSGYPTGVVDSEIQPWARICAAVDVFDALTCKRSYRPAISLNAACSHLAKYKGTWFDEDVVDCWEDMVIRATR